jgi:hypothetical protein
MAHWLLQGNPLSWRIHDFFTAGHTRTTWTLRRNHDQAAAGDDVALWLTGREGGVVAIGVVTGPATYGPASSYDLQHDEGWTLPVSFHRHFLDEPVSRAALKADERFASEQILRAPGSGNPFPLSPEAWAAVLEQVPPSSDGSQLVARTVMVGAAVAAGAATAVREAFRSVTSL